MFIRGTYLACHFGDIVIETHTARGNRRTHTNAGMQMVMQIGDGTRRGFLSRPQESRLGDNASDVAVMMWFALSACHFIWIGSGVRVQNQQSTGHPPLGMGSSVCPCTHTHSTTPCQTGNTYKRYKNISQMLVDNCDNCK